MRERMTSTEAVLKDICGTHYEPGQVRLIELFTTLPFDAQELRRLAEQIDGDVTLKALYRLCHATYEQQAKRVTSILAVLVDVCGANFTPGCHMLFKDRDVDVEELRRLAEQIDGDVTPDALVERLDAETPSSGPRPGGLLFDPD
jgi:hypothetical protein